MPLLGVVFSVGAMAESALIPQNTDSLTIHSQIVGQYFSDAFSTESFVVWIDYGQQKEFTDEAEQAVFKDTKGNRRRFKTMPDAMDYLSAHGWKYVDSFTTRRKDEDMVFWIMQKKVPRNGVEFFEKKKRKK